MFEDEPDTKPGLTDCDNAVIVPHIASASFWTRAGMVRPPCSSLHDRFLGGINVRRSFVIQLCRRANGMRAPRGAQPFSFSSSQCMLS